jgi:hypothetical protein
VKVTDVELDDILFLDRHPAWTYTDLLAAPEGIVDGLKRLDFKRASGA